MARPLLLLFSLLAFLPGQPSPAETGRHDQEPTLEERLAAVDLLADAWFATHPGQTTLPSHLEFELTHLQEQHPLDPRPLQTLGRLATELGQEQQAEQSLQAALELDPQNPETLWLLAGLAVKQTDMLTAADYYAQAVQSPAARAVHHFDLATVLVLFRHELTGQRFGETSQAVLRTGLDHYRAAIKMAPDQIDYSRALAETYYSVEPPDWDAAREAWFAVYQLSPERHQTIIHLARVCIRNERFDEAEWWLQQIDRPNADALVERLLDQARAGQQPHPSSSHE